MCMISMIMLYASLMMELAGVLTDRIYEFGKRPSGMDPAACDFEIWVSCKLMVDLISIGDHGPGRSVGHYQRTVHAYGKHR